MCGIKGGARFVSWSSDSSLLVVGGNCLTVLKRETELGDSSGAIHFKRLFEQPQPSPVVAVSLSCDSRFFASLNESSPIVTVWYCQNGKLEFIFLVDAEAPLVPIISVQWMPSRDLSPAVLIAVNRDGKIVVYEESSFTSELQFRERYVFSLSPSPISSQSQWAVNWSYLYPPVCTVETFWESSMCR